MLYFQFRIVSCSLVFLVFQKIDIKNFACFITLQVSWHTLCPINLLHILKDANSTQIIIFPQAHNRGNQPCWWRSYLMLYCMPSDYPMWKSLLTRSFSRRLSWIIPLCFFQSRLTQDKDKKECHHKILFLFDKYARAQSLLSPTLWGM